jgi:hypothetical protein
MAVGPAGVRRAVERACARPGTPGTRARRGFGAVISPLPAVGGPWTW